MALSGVRDDRAFRRDEPPTESPGSVGEDVDSPYGLIPFLGAEPSPSSRPTDFLPRLTLASRFDPRSRDGQNRACLERLGFMPCFGRRNPIF